MPRKHQPKRKLKPNFVRHEITPADTRNPYVTLPGGQRIKYQAKPKDIGKVICFNINSGGQLDNLLYTTTHQV